MNISSFVQQLRATAEELKPLTLSASSMAATWDGTKYVKGEAHSANPTALVWFSVLTTVADLVEAQESPLTPRQFEYLKRLLFGGMGSLNDVSLGHPAVDHRLSKRRHLLFETFRE